MKAAGIECVGKELIGDMYELNPQILKERLFGEKAASVELDVKPVPRPPVLCPDAPTVASSIPYPATRTR